MFTMVKHICRDAKHQQSEEKDSPLFAVKISSVNKQPANAAHKEDLHGICLCVHLGPLLPTLLFADDDV